MNGSSSKSLTIDARDSANRAFIADSGVPARLVRIETTWRILKYTYGLVPIVAGLDKFTNILTNWVGYLNPLVLKVLPLSGSTFMHVAGIVEFLAGIIVLARPRIGGYIVAAWLTCIALSLIAGGRFLDVAVRDLVMAIGAFTMANLTETHRS